MSQKETPAEEIEGRSRTSFPLPGSPGFLSPLIFFIQPAPPATFASSSGRRLHASAPLAASVEVGVFGTILWQV